MIKVAFLDYSPVFAGAERVLYNMISHIDRTKYEPYLIFPFPMEHQDRYDGLDCNKIWLSDSKKWWMGSDRWKKPVRGTDFIKRSVFGLKISSVVKKHQIDILDVNLMRFDVKMWVWATRKFTNAKIAGHYRSQEQDWVAPPSAQKLFDVIACVSRFSRMRFQLKGDFVRSEVLYDSVDVDVMKSSLTKESAKEKLGYSSETLLLVSVGQLSPHKGHDNAIRAFGRISDKYPEARLLIAGGGGKTLVEYYKSIAEECGVSDKVNVPGSQFSNIQDIYRAADLTLSLTKVGEGFGLVPYESTLLGTPFIAPEFGAVTEFVTDKITGLLVDTNDIDAVTKKLDWALSNYDKCKTMVYKLEEIIKEQLSPEMLSCNLDKLYSSL